MDWIKSLLQSNEIESRLDACRERYQVYVENIGMEGAPNFSDINDQAAWYVLQSETYAAGRRFYVPDECARIVPFITAIGRHLEGIRSIPGAEDRASRIISSEKTQPDSGIYELLVAAAYLRGGWKNVEFVPEQKGGRKTPDIFASRSRTALAVECKRMASTEGSYAATEKAAGSRIASMIHNMSEDRGVPLIVDIIFHGEVHVCNAAEILSEVENFCHNPVGSVQAAGDGFIAKFSALSWDRLRYVMASDDLYVGTSRMMELATGAPQHEFDHSIRVRFRRAKGRPSYADHIYHLSQVNWLSVSDEAVHRKSKHFKKTIAKAERQLPSDRTGIIHVGMNARGRRIDDDYRHRQNLYQAKIFSNKTSNLRWIYGNYFTLENTTRKNESLAMNETMVPYRVGRHRTAEPVPYHMLVADEQGEVDNLNWGFPT